VRADGRRDESGVDVTTWGAALELESPSALGRWVYGVDVARDEVDSFSRRYKADGSLNKVEAQGPVADDATYDLVGVFVQDTAALFGGALEATPGVRYPTRRWTRTACSTRFPAPSAPVRTIGTASWARCACFRRSGRSGATPSTAAFRRDSARRISPT
jgi:hypothetical protein